MFDDGTAVSSLNFVGDLLCFRGRGADERDGLWLRPVLVQDDIGVIGVLFSGLYCWLKVSCVRLDEVVVETMFSMPLK